MKIYIDVSVLTLATFITGIQRVTREVTLGLLDEMQPFEDVILLHYNARDNAYHRIDNQRFMRFYREKKGAKSRMITKTVVPISEIGAGALFFDLDAAWMSRVKRSYLLPILKRQGAKIVGHIYDIISVQYPQFCLERGVYNFMDFIAAHLQYDDAIIVNAQATVERLQELADRCRISLPTCHVVPLGANYGAKREQKRLQPEQANAVPAEVTPANAVPASATPVNAVPAEVTAAAQSGKYLLMVGTVEPRKNHRLLLDAYEQGIREMGYSLIFAGYMGWHMEAFEDRLYQHPDFGKRIFHFEGLDDAAISYLYQNASYLVFASYEEGYGLPIVEAILKGIPVLAADIPVLREVGEDYCVWFAQNHPEDLVAKLRENAPDTEKYKAMLAHFSDFQRHTWQDTVQGMREALEQA